MKTGTHISVFVVSQSFGGTRWAGPPETSEVWSGVVPHDTDYETLHREGSELGRELLHAIARQDPWEVIGVVVAETPKPREEPDDG